MSTPYRSCDLLSGQENRRCQDQRVVWCQLLSWARPTGTTRPERQSMVRDEQRDETGAAQPDEAQSLLRAYGSEFVMVVSPTGEVLAGSARLHARLHPRSVGDPRRRVPAPRRPSPAVPGARAGSRHLRLPRPDPRPGPPRRRDVATARRRAAPATRARPVRGQRHPAHPRHHRRSGVVDPRAGRGAGALPVPGRVAAARASCPPTRAAGSCSATRPPSRSSTSRPTS